MDTGESARLTSAKLSYAVTQGRVGNGVASCSESDGRSNQEKRTKMLVVSLQLVVPLDRKLVGLGYAIALGIDIVRIKQ